MFTANNIRFSSLTKKGELRKPRAGYVHVTLFTYVIGYTVLEITAGTRQMKSSMQGKERFVVVVESRMVREWAGYSKFSSLG